MYSMIGMDLSKRHREEIAQQVENNHLARRLRASRSGMPAGTGDTLLERVFASSVRKKQVASY